MLHRPGNWRLTWSQPNSDRSGDDLRFQQDRVFLPYDIATKYAQQTGLIDKLAPHDMRRTCAKLCRESGGDLEQIQFLLGHASIQTTERYLGSRQNLKEAVNDRLGLDD